MESEIRISNSGGVFLFQTANSLHWTSLILETVITFTARGLAVEWAKELAASSVTTTAD